MATVTKRTRKNKDGSTTTRYIVRWLDPRATPPRRSRKFKLKAPADSFCAKIQYRLEMGLPAEGKDIGLVQDVCQAWCDHFEELVTAGKREATTWAGYDQHLRLHIAQHPVAKIKLKAVTPPDCQAFASWLEKTRTAAMAAKVMTSFRTMLDHGVSLGEIPVNPADTIKVEAKGRALLSDAEGDAEERAVIPELHEVRAILEAATAISNEDQGRALAMLHLATFPALRISEIRGVGVQHVQVFGDRQTVKIRRRADAKNNLGPPKSKSSYRTLPLGQDSVRALRAWLYHVTPSPDGLLFATENGKPYSYSHLYRHVLVPVMVKATERGADLVTLHPVPDNDGNPTVRDGGHFAGPYCPLLARPRYSFHELRHVGASLRIAAGASPKAIQEFMGHSSIQVTMNIYGHLWHNPEDTAATVRAVEAMVLNAKKNG